MFTEQLFIMISYASESLYIQMYVTHSKRENVEKIHTESGKQKGV